MADRRHIPIPLSNLSRGINRFAAEAGADQCADTLNAINDSGEVRRRDAFVPVGSGPPHLFPAGHLIVLTEATLGSGTFVSAATRTPALGSVNAIYLGLRVATPAPVGQFDGLDFRNTDTVSPSLAAHLVVDPQYWNGSAWTSVPSFVDETKDLSSGYFAPFLRNGRIYWHTDQITASWTTRSVNSTTAYWMRLVIRTLAGTATTLGGTLTTKAPGLRAFVFAPVNAIFPVRIERRASIVLASDRKHRNTPSTGVLDGEHRQLFAGGLEKGAQLGVKTETLEETRVAPLLEDETAGTYGEIVWPRPTRNGTGIGSSGLTYGTASRLQKIRTQVYDPDSARLVPYQWAINQWRGGVLSGSLTPVATFAASTVRVTALASGLSSVAGFYRGCRIRCTTAGGVALNEEREVREYEVGGTNIFYVYPDWSAAPTGSARFTVYGPPAIAYHPSDRTVWGEAKTNAEHTIELSATGDYVPATTVWTNFIGYLRLGRELRWTTDAADRWTGVVDTITGRLIVTNGRSGLLEYDGSYLRRLQADFRSLGALAYVGALPDVKALSSGDYKVNALSLLRRAPPSGKYIVAHQSRVFVAGFESEPFTVRWSAPGGLNNVWPLLYEDIIRDTEADPIVGMVTLDERLVVFTPTAIHEALGPDDSGRFSFQPLSQGIGFVAHQAVCVIATGGSSQLVGIAPDGIYAFAGGEPTVVLDDWNRVLDGGVNQDALSLSLSCAAPQRSWALFAVTPRGASTNTRILVWDYQRNAWWVWSAPFGVSSMAVDYDEAGKERILFGCDDGYLMTLGDGATDDGSTITSYATSPPVQPFGGQECSLSGLVLTAKTLGGDSSQQMECDVLSGDDAAAPLQDGVLSIDDGAPRWGTATWDSFTWTKAGFRSVRMNIVSYAKAHRVAYRVGGLVKWAVKAAELIAQPKSRRGR